MSNRFVLIEREFIHPTICGVDFGGKCWCVARSPAAVLIWVFGHSWSVNGNQRYAEPSLILLPDRRSLGNLIYRHIHCGGRLGRSVIALEWPKLAASFDDAAAEIMAAVHDRKTLLIEGGGPRLMPHRMRFEVEYRAWRDLPAEDRGFFIGGGR